MLCAFQKELYIGNTEALKAAKRGTVGQYNIMRQTSVSGSIFEHGNFLKKGKIIYKYKEYTGRYLEHKTMYTSGADKAISPMKYKKSGSSGDSEVGEAGDLKGRELYKIGTRRIVKCP